ncbi:hypothetical protein L2E82_47274 [Cichorium intybus]|uniref:Uncharacterized protein n=1 Tax=Cichorium intybus TaxID=13427 RepID=A0ACB8YZ74_CICIN|nr:hypothetical protein L2E82_47274 [Cichorium intybus]
MSVKPEEITAIVNDFNEPGSLAPTGLYLGGTKYMVIQDNPKKVDHLLKLEGAKERLHLFKANLLEECSFDAAVVGCEGVSDTTSPFFHAVTDPQAELIDLAVIGTLNVLTSCSKASSVKRLVTEELGMNLDNVELEMLGSFEKKAAIYKCNVAGNPAVVTRLVDSMTDNLRATRAEATDVGIAVLDG